MKEKIRRILWAVIAVIGLLIACAGAAGHRNISAWICLALFFVGEALMWIGLYKGEYLI